MNLQEFAKLLRARWITVVITTVAALLAAAVVTLFTKPLYQASTRLFVSTTAGASAADLYQGNRLSQDRVLSYAELITGGTLIQRTIDKLNLGIDSAELQKRVTASAKPNTVLIDVSVLDPSPVRARDIADAISNEFVLMVRELETPVPGMPPDARVVVQQRAEIPTKPAVPNPVRNIAVGLGVGVLLGVGLALLRDRLDNTVKDRGAVETVTGLGLVGTIPFDRTVRAKITASFDTYNSLIAESFRKLRTNLHFLSVDHPPRVIVVTSSLPDEGKTTTAVNTALALAEADHNVLLVDGDLRRPTLAKRLNLTDSVGFSTVLSGGASLEEVLQETSFSNLTVLASGPIPPNPTELCGSLAAQKLIRELSDRYDYVIIDTSPLLAVSDGAILAANSDGALVVIAYGRTKRDQLADAVRSLNDVGASLLGAVFSLVPSGKGSSYGYSYGYATPNPDEETLNHAGEGPAVFQHR